MGNAIRFLTKMMDIYFDHLKSSESKFKRYFMMTVSMSFS
jgi:hypothetical protein